MDLQLDGAADQRVLTALRTAEYRRAAELMIKLYGAGVMRRCRAVATDLGGAEDLVNAAYVRALASFTGFRAEGSPARWLLGIADVVCVDAFKEKVAAGERPQIEQVDSAYFDDLDLDVDQARELLHGLAGADRSALGLRLWCGVDDRRLAELLESRKQSCRLWTTTQLSRLSRRAGGKCTDVTMPATAAETLYPRLVAALTRVNWPISESLTRRLEVLSAAL